MSPPCSRYTSPRCEKAPLSRLKDIEKSPSRQVRDILEAMFLTTHAAAGIALSRVTNDPLAVFGLAFASHFVLDFIPHGDEHLYHDEEWKVQKRYRRVVLINTLDVLGLLGLTLWAIGQHPAGTTNLLVIAILGAVLPDFLSYLFPVIHERFSWLFLVRWLYAITKPTGLRYVVRTQNWFHNLLHHEIIRRDIPLSVGIMMQLVLIGIFISFVR